METLVRYGIDQKTFDLISSVYESKNFDLHLAQLKSEIETQDPQRLISVLKRSIVLKMHGCDPSFCYPHSILLCSHENQYIKQTGYKLCLKLLSHQEGLLCVNTLERDLKSKHPQDQALSLDLTRHLMSKDIVHTLFPLVESLLTSTVRQKALLALKSIYLLEPSYMNLKKIKKLLGDQDPQVMMACVEVIETISQSEDISSILEPIVHILNQIIQQNVDCFFQGVCCPQTQIHIFKILSRSPQNHAEVVLKSLMSLDFNKKEPMPYAVAFEGIQTILKLDPHNPNLQPFIDSFLNATAEESIYFGLRCLEVYLKVNPDLKYCELVPEIYDGPVPLYVKQHILLQVLPLLCTDDNVSNCIQNYYLPGLDLFQDTFYKETILKQTLQMTERLSDQKQLELLMHLFLNCPESLCSRIARQLLKLPLENWALNQICQIISTTSLETQRVKECCWILGTVLMPEEAAKQVLQLLSSRLKMTKDADAIATIVECMNKIMVNSRLEPTLDIQQSVHQLDHLSESVSRRIAEFDSLNHQITQSLLRSRP
ncbi:armadillo-type protein [Gorgonomyces haynaldii]|nr:armadillo-type protein [Gorgonomyces haynaldii]